MKAHASRAAARNRAILTVFECCPDLNRAALSGLEWHDYDPARRRLSIPGPHTTRRAVPLSAAAGEALAAWLDLRGNPPGPLFVTCALFGSDRLTAVKVYGILAHLAHDLGELADRAATVLHRQMEQSPYRPLQPARLGRSPEQEARIAAIGELVRLYPDPADTDALFAELKRRGLR